MKRHLLVTNDFPPKVGGIQNYLWELWSRLDPASFVVLTASSDPGAAAFDAAQAERGVRIERVPGAILFFPTPAALAAVRALRRGARDRPRPARPRAPARAPRARTSTSPTASSSTGPRSRCPGRLPGARAALARVLRGARLVVSAGQLPGGRGAAAPSPGITAPLVEIPPGVDTGAIVPLKAAERRAARARLGLPGAGAARRRA